jgi:DNA-binding transcriptional ArsR family regulator
VAAFVAPAPVIAAPDIRLELAAMRTHPVEGIQADLDALGLPRYEDPVAAIERVATTIEAYWELAVAPYWPRIRAVLEADVRHRAHLLSTGGSRQLFSDLDPNLRWEDGKLGVRLRSNRSGTVELDGRGLVLAPSAFAWPRVSLLTVPPWQPLLRYPARGTGTIWESRPAAPSHALARVIGRPKARLLTLLHEPATTTQLAALTGLTVGGASQHLTALRDAGLVCPTRIGRSILYARTETAEALMSEASEH